MPVLRLTVTQQQAQRLERKARQIGRSASRTCALLLDEALRRDEFAFIEFRDSPVGRQAYIHGSRLAVWQVIAIFGSYQDDVVKTAAHLEWPAAKVEAALNYSRAFPDEIEAALCDSNLVIAKPFRGSCPALRYFRCGGEEKSNATTLPS